MVVNMYILSFFSLKQLSEVIRAEAETCFQDMQIKIQLLLLFLMITNNLVLTKVKPIQNIILSLTPTLNNLIEES